METCPKCGYQRKKHDSHVMAGVCPSCGIAYAKWQAGNESGDQSHLPATELSGFQSEPVLSLRKRLSRQFLSPTTGRGRLPSAVQIVILIGLVVWGWMFILGGIDWISIGGSFLHNVNLPFHEFGHVLFAPFGRFMAILGGSLFQIMMPLIALAVFSFQQKDNFAASAMLWWCGQNFIDVAPYIADAPSRSIPLIRGMGESAHDWGNLLTMTGTLDLAGVFAATSFVIGSLVMIAANIWMLQLIFADRSRLL